MNAKNRAVAGPVAALATGAIVAALAPAAFAQAQDDGKSFRFQLGLTAVSGMNELEDAIIANNPAFSAISVSPIGLSAAFGWRVASDFGVIASIGPIIIGTGDASFTIVPAGLSVRYDLFSGQAGGSAYARLGVEQAIASGDFVENGSAGAVAALGYASGGLRRGGWGLELAYRAAKVDVPGRTAALNKSVQPYKASLTAFWAF
jgi:hypothetical protein